MRYIAINCLLILLIGTVQLYDLETVEPIPLGSHLDVIKRTLTPNEKEQILNGVNGAKEFMKFLEEKNFFKMLTKISSVAGPIFSVASAVISIAFLFIDAESPEMALMKKEFKQLNNRIDKWSAEFDEIKRKIEWSAVQVGFGDIENTIISLSRMVANFENVPESIRETEKKRFLNAYEIDYKASVDLLYNAMVNIDQIYSANLFRAAQKFLENDRNQVQIFMIKLTSLLTQAIQVEAMYVKLKYNSEENSHFVQSLWQKQLVVLKDKMGQIDRETRDLYRTQYEKDLDKLLKTQFALNNQEFNSMAYDFFTTKYDWRAWFVLVYAKFLDLEIIQCRRVLAHLDSERMVEI